MSHQNCSVCSKAAPRPALLCMTCFESASTGISKTTKANPHYCITRCRNNDTRQHGSACIAERLSRAADILQASFYLWREIVFDVKIKKVERINGILHAHEHYYKPNMTDDVLFDFPNGMVCEPEDKAALLTYCACDDAAAYMFELSKILLQSDGTEEITPYSHATLAIEASNGRSYIVDMGGAQFGQHRALVPFKEYRDRQNAQVVAIHPHGYYANEQKKIREGKQSYDGNMAQEIGAKYDYRVLHVQNAVLKSFLRGVEKWEERDKMKVQRMLSCREAEYQELRTSLLNSMKEEMELFMIAWKLDGCKIKAHPVQQKSKVKVPNVMEEMQRELKGQADGTVYPEGRGSRAYQQFSADKEASVYQKMPKDPRDFIEQFKSSGGHVFHA